MPATEEIRLLPGMTGEVVAIIQSVAGDDSDLILVPAVALVADERGNQRAWIVDEESMTVTARPVTVGSLRGADQIEVTGGLNDGERIAISGANMLREGAEVTLWDPFGKGSER